MTAKYSSNAVFSRHLQQKEASAATAVGKAAPSVFQKLVRDPHFWQPAMQGAGAIAALGLGAAASKLLESKRKAKAYKDMLGLHPRLHSYEDQPHLQRMYNSLHNVNPTMAKDPMVAGAWLDTIVESGGIDQTQQSRALLESVKELAGIRAHISRAKATEGSLPKTLAGGVSAGIGHAFSRAKDLEKDHGEAAALRQQLKDQQSKQIANYWSKVERGVPQMAQQHGVSTQDLLDAVISGSFK